MPAFFVWWHKDLTLFTLCREQSAVKSCCI
jgi:hypothetical protein